MAFGGLLGGIGVHGDRHVELGVVGVGGVYLPLVELLWGVGLTEHTGGGAPKRLRSRC